MRRSSSRASGARVRLRVKSAGSRDSLVDRARETPLTRAAVQELADAAGLDAATVRAALDRGDAHAATVLALACVAAEVPLDAATLRALLPEVESHDMIGPLAAAASDASASEVLTGALADGAMVPEREAIALLVLADLLGGEAPPPDAVRAARRLTRKDIDVETAIFLGAAAARLGDRHLTTLAAEDVKRATRSKKVAEETIALGRRSPLALLGDVAPARMIAGYTVRKESAVGRNDACPCGSGKKFKKCCALKEGSRGEAKIATTTLDAEQTSLMRPAELRSLDRQQLPPKAWLGAFRRALEIADLGLAEQMIAEAEARGDDRQRVTDLRVTAFGQAVVLGDVRAAERLLTGLPREDAAREGLTLALLRGDADALTRLDAAAEAAIRDEDDGAALVDLALSVLRAKPALGIVLARGAMHEGRTAECQLVLEEMEDARDRLLLSPVEPWWDFYQGMLDTADDIDDAVARSAEKAKLARELRKARTERTRAITELTRLRERLDELDARAASDTGAPTSKATGKAKTEPTSAPAPLSAELEEERRRLRSKVAELRRIVSEGQEERRELRRQLSETETEGDATPEAPRHAASSSASDDDERAKHDEDLEDGEAGEAPRDLLIPTFTDRAAKALRDLDPGTGAAVLTLVAALASGRDNAWAGTKQLVKVRGVLSARAGIHHRVLFRVEGRTLTVLEVLARKDLEQIVARLAARGDL